MLLYNHQVSSYIYLVINSALLYTQSLNVLLYDGGNDGEEGRQGRRGGYAFGVEMLIIVLVSADHTHKSCGVFECHIINWEIFMDESQMIFLN